MEEKEYEKKERAKKWRRRTIGEKREEREKRKIKNGREGIRKQQERQGNGGSGRE